MVQYATTVDRTFAALADPTRRAVLERLGAPSCGVAVALDGAVVPRVSWSGTPLQDDARIDVLPAVQGG